MAWGRSGRGRVVDDVGSLRRGGGELEAGVRLDPEGLCCAAGRRLVPDKLEWPVRREERPPKGLEEGHGRWWNAVRKR